jgi:uncharacterized protein YqjF (DUF2071 family)
VSDAAELGVLGALTAARVALSAGEIVEMLGRAGVSRPDAVRAVDALREAGLITGRSQALELSGAGISRFLELHGEIQAALAVQEECPSLPWLTQVQTRWIDALSFNYAVVPEALATLLPPPLEPELHRGSAWVQVLLSSLRDMRPQGLGAAFGVCFYQVSYRAAVRYRSADGSARRGGFFIRSDTNHQLMRAIGNALAEFKFHHFGAADVVMLREGERLTVGVDPRPEFPGGKIFGVIETSGSDQPPPGSVWRSLDELHEPLVECYDALGVDRERGYLYVLTIDRDPWNPRFVDAERLYCEYFDRGALAGAGRLDSILHFHECAYRWRPLRREPLT